ncbi:MAG TPA: flippase [Methylomirabilota bacterium]|nr:flippase [Methylomirabilota bacterium]
MDPLKSILRNSSLLIGAQGLSSLIGMAVVVLVPRFLGAAEYGRLHLALSLAMMYSVAVEFGLTPVLARAVAQDRSVARPYLRGALVLMTLLGAGFYVALLATVRLLGYPERVHELVAILGVVMIGEALSQVLAALFQAHERMVIPAIARITGNVFTIGLVAPLLVGGRGALAVATVMALASVLRVGIQALGVRRLEGLRTVSAPAATTPWALLAAGLPFFVWEALGIFYFRVGVVMLSRMSSEATVGWYGAASRLLDALNFLPEMLTLATFPVAARLWVTSPTEFRQTVRKAFSLLLVATVPATVVLLTLAHEIVEFLFTLPAFGPSIPILRIHGLTLALLFVDFFLGGVLMAVGRERAWVMIASGACLLNPALNWVLIPLTDQHFGNGGIGAALATVATEAFVMVWALRVFPRGTFGRESWRVALRASGAGVLLAVFLLLGRLTGVPWMLVGALGGLGYLGLVIWLEILPEDITRLARGLLARRAAPEVA